VFLDFFRILMFRRELEQALNDELQARHALDGQHEVPIQLLSELV
jgi:hypothetical protein